MTEKIFYGIVEEVHPITYGLGMSFFRIRVDDKEYDTKADVDVGDFLTFTLMPDILDEPEIPVIRVLAFTNRYSSA